MSKLRDGALWLRVRERIKDGRLPVMIPMRVDARYGTGHICVVCDQPVTSAQVEYELDDYRDSKRLCFHLDCHTIWRMECERHA